jgi:hypothetical protein
MATGTTGAVGAPPPFLRVPYRRTFSISTVACALDDLWAHVLKLVVMVLRLQPPRAAGGAGGGVYLAAAAAAAAAAGSSVAKCSSLSLFGFCGGSSSAPSSRRGGTFAPAVASLSRPLESQRPQPTRPQARPRCRRRCLGAVRVLRPPHRRHADMALASVVHSGGRRC